MFIGAQHVLCRLAVKLNVYEFHTIDNTQVKVDNFALVFFFDTKTLSMMLFIIAHFLINFASKRVVNDPAGFPWGYKSLSCRLAG